jgi:hypothetical protein
MKTNDAADFESPQAAVEKNKCAAPSKRAPLVRLCD